MINGTIAAMKRRDGGGHAAAKAKKKGLDSVDKAPDCVKAALRKGDVTLHMWAVKTLLNGGASFTISDQRCAT